MPLDKRVCLMLEPGPPIWHQVTIDAAKVADINLRTYASAQWAIYGPNQQVVQDVRTDARRNRARVAEYVPRPPRFMLFESVEGQLRPEKTTVFRPPAGRPERRPAPR